MPYDLYGKYYASSRDAENAEMAQCAEIDARLAYEKVTQLEEQIGSQPDYEMWQKVDYLMSKIEEFENKIKILENK